MVTTTNNNNSNNGDDGTYEATMARKSTHRQPDRISWERHAAFRDQPYRQLHHQKGLIGTFQVRLLEASGLQRSYWSALALGPVKHLGLSKAHGPISSYCTLTLDTEPHSSSNNNNSNECHAETLFTDQDGKMPAKLSGSSSNRNRNSNNNNHNNTMMNRGLSQPVVVSPVMPQDNHPVWSDVHFELPLRKGSLRDQDDGMRLFLKVRVDEEAHVAEKIIPGLPNRGDDRLIGKGRVDVTSLCLGETLLGQTQVGVLDAWIPIYYDAAKDHEQQQQQQAMAAAAAAAASHKKDPLQQQQQQQQQSSSFPLRKKQVGRVRVLISFRPNGMDPQQNDVVALESFARRPLLRSSCAPILPPLLPMTVKEVRGCYLLVEYQFPVETTGSSRSHNNNNNSNNKACMRLHRNAVFVIERKNIIDATVGLAMLPADAIMSTPLGQTGAQILGPAIHAGKEVLMPAMLSFKLVFMALRTTAFAGLTGVQAAGGAIWNEGASAWTHNQNEES